MLNKAKRKLNLIIGYDICAYYTFQEYMGHEIDFLTRQQIQSLFIAFSFGIIIKKIIICIVPTIRHLRS